MPAGGISGEEVRDRVGRAAQHGAPVRVEYRRATGGQIEGQPETAASDIDGHRPRDTGHDAPGEQRATLPIARLNRGRWLAG